ncbi:MAG: ATPase, partial [Planctomycetes bacterium]|nr:ATPase [Planctomycetota bacterium]
MLEDLRGLIPRMQAGRLRAALGTMRVVVLTGARQTGKTTLARVVGAQEGRHYVSLDRPETL